MYGNSLWNLPKESIIPMDNVIRISNSTLDLTGQGTEYLVVNDQVIAKFYDGNLIVYTLQIDTNEVTKTAA